MGWIKFIIEKVNDLQGKPNFTEEELKELRDIKKKAIMKEHRAIAEKEGREIARGGNDNGHSIFNLK